MKAVLKVNTDGLYMEDDAFSGVVPFYAKPKSDAYDAGEIERPINMEEEELEVAGYNVGIPVPSGLFLPRFDLADWEAYQDELHGSLSD